MHSFAQCFFQDMLTNFYWNQYILDGDRAKKKLEHFLDKVSYNTVCGRAAQCTFISNSISVLRHDVMLSVTQHTEMYHCKLHQHYDDVTLHWFYKTITTANE